MKIKKAYLVVRDLEINPFKIFFRSKVFRDILFEYLIDEIDIDQFKESTAVLKKARGE